MIVKENEKIGEIIKNYLESIKKANLLNALDYKICIDSIWFIYNGSAIKISDYDKKASEFFFSNSYPSIIVNGNISRIDYEIIETIKDNLFTSVYKAKLSNGKLVAVKKIFKDKLKEEMKFSKCKDVITDEEFKPEIDKFNREISNMKRCYCENSVEIFDYFDTEKEFIILMELCDETLFHVLCRKKNGFSAEEIKVILLQ